MNRIAILFLASALFAAASCGDDAPVDRTDAGPDSGQDAGAPDDAEGDRDASSDVGPDGGAACAPAPDPIVAGTSRTDPLANAPARCGMPAYSWLRDASLGDVVELGESQEFGAALINVAAAAAEIELPRPAEYDVTIEQVVYRTQDRGDFVDATTLVAYPQGVEPDTPTPIVLLLHGTAGFTDACSPSLTREQKALAAIFATYGYIAVAPDYIGLKGLGDPTGFKHPYLVGEATAIASLDAIRAVFELPSDRLGGLCPLTEFAFFGGSQGGHAGLWVDRLAPYYARELTPLGGVATVPPADLVAQMERALQEIVPATGNTVAFLGASADWYGHEGDLDQVFVAPFDTEVPRILGETCDPDEEIETEPTSLGELFTAPILEAAGNGAIAEYGFAGCMTVENSLTTTSIERIPSTLPAYGILNVFGEADQLVHTPIERLAYEQLCESGLPYDYLECLGAGHVDATFWVFDEIFSFVEARLAREPFEAPESCAPPAAVTCSGTPNN